MEPKGIYWVWVSHIDFINSPIRPQYAILTFSMQYWRMQHIYFSPEIIVSLTTLTDLVNGALDTVLTTKIEPLSMVPAVRLQVVERSQYRIVA